MPSLKEYVLISQREPLVEVFRREAEDRWSRTEARLKAAAKLVSIACELSVDAVYEGVELPGGTR